MEEFTQNLGLVNPVTKLPWGSVTKVWGYSGTAVDPKNPAAVIPFKNFPSGTFEATRGKPIRVKWINNLGAASLMNLPAPGSTLPILTVDQTLHWAAPLGMNMMDMTPYQGPVATVPHLHGAEDLSEYDGGPEAWFTSTGLRGGAFRTADWANTDVNSTVYEYPNTQEAATLWYHDHALGATRLNVYGGLAGFYLLRDPAKEPASLPKGAPYEIPFVIQDRQFDTNGQLLFPNVGLNPTIHPYWMPEFFGNFILVNGVVWPKLNVEPRRYRFRFLDGSNARFYSLSLQDLTNPKNPKPGPAFWQIGTDGGLLDTPVKLNDPALFGTPTPGPTLLFAPGERADVIIDFSAYAGKTLTMVNVAKAPFPGGATPSPQNEGRIVQIVVSATPVTDTSYNPATAAAGSLRPTNPVVRLTANQAVKVRHLTLNEIMGPAGPQEILVNNTKWTGKRTGIDPTLGPVGSLQIDGNWISETPKVGTTEVWEIINLTADTHPIHTHLAQFQLLSRQTFQANKYTSAYNAAFPAVGGMAAGMMVPGYGPPKGVTFNGLDPVSGLNFLDGNPDVTTFLQMAPRGPDANEYGWKDTVRANTGEITRFAVRYTSQDKPIGAYDTTTAYPPVSVTDPVTKVTTTIPFNPAVTALGSVDRNGLIAATPPGYVWHCHIIDHEDNEMMRPYIPVP